MRFSTNDGKFGFLVSPFENSRGMFRFQLIIDSALIGDTDPCFLETAMIQLGNLPHLEDRRLRSLLADPQSVFSALLYEKDLHDRATLPLAESMDHWLIHGYVHDGNVVMIVRGDRDGTLAGPDLISTLSVKCYKHIFDATCSYWRLIRNSLM